MASLLAISYDIRAIILDLVLFTPSIPASSPHDFHSAALTTKGIFLANRQLHTEILDRINHHGPLTYRLNVDIEDESQATATWTHVPILLKHVPVVHTTITAATGSRCTDGRPRRHNLFDRGCGWPPGATWYFYDAMQRFTMHNPDAALNIFTINHTIGLLDIDVRTPTLASNQRFHPDGRGNLQEQRFTNVALDPNFEYVMTPEYLADFLAGEMGCLLRMTYHTAIYGAFMYSSIGSVKISVDGKLSHEWDLGKFLAEFPENGPVEAFRKGRDGDWKDFYASAIKDRKELGLTVLERESLLREM